MRGRAIKHVIHWFSPLPPARTDIAEYTRRILPALNREAQVILWTDQGVWDPGLEAYAAVRTYDPDTFSPANITDARRALDIPPDVSDGVFINIGNNWLFHAGLLSVAQRVTSVVILHDLVLQEMLLDSVRHGKLDGTGYLDAIEENYGSTARKTAQDALAGRHGTRRAMLAYPGLELVTKASLSVISHSEAAHQFFRHKPSTDPLILNLPFPVTDTVTARRLRSGPVRLVQFGHIGPNRRLLQILGVLGSLRDRLEFRFDIVGQIWDEGLVKRKIDACGLQGFVHLHGYLPELRLDELISEAHLVFNLRYPTMGEASGSQLRIWSRGGCSVVSDHGWYASLPADTVLKIPVEPGADTDSLRRLLLDLDHDRSKFWSVGEAGLVRLRNKHSPDRYAEDIYRVCEKMTLMSRELLIRRQMRSNWTPAPRL